jgi:hypothetical protein
VFDHVLAALVHGGGYERLASPGCLDRTIRRRLGEWAQAGHGRQLLRLALTTFDRMIVLDLDGLALDGAITKAPCGGEVAGRNPVDRGKQGTKRSLACDGDGIPLHLVAARANDHDSPLLEPTLAGIPHMSGPLPERPCLHLDRATTRPRPAICCRSWATRPRSPSRRAGAGPGRQRWPVERRALG